MLNCEHVEKRYGLRKSSGKNAVSDVSLTVADGRICMLLGPNGSGKSTLMKMIAGLIHPTSGSITFDQNPIGITTKAQIAYMPTETYFYSYMTWKNAGKYYEDFFADFSMDTYRRLLEDFELKENEKITKQSSGMTAKGKLALALARNARLTMLDEPLNGVDLIARDQILNGIASVSGHGRSFLISSHLVEELATMSDDAVFLRAGQLVKAGSLKELTADGITIVDLYRSIYGTAGAQGGTYA